MTIVKSIINMLGFLSAAGTQLLNIPKWWKNRKLDKEIQDVIEAQASKPWTWTNILRK